MDDNDEFELTEEQDTKMAALVAALDAIRASIEADKLETLRGAWLQRLDSADYAINEG